MTTELDKYPNRIRELRRAQGLTQQQLGEMVGITSVHVGHLELGRRDISLTQLRALARALGVDTVELLAADDNPLSATPRGRNLARHWHNADEQGRQAIERVAESFAEYRTQPDIAPDAPLAPPMKKDGRKRSSG